LHIKSPSRVFAEIGEFSTLGMAEGLEASSKAVAAAAANVGSAAVNAMRKSIRNISDTLSKHIDTNPTITPVLDLTQFQRDARQLGDLSNVTPITAAASYGQAAFISASQPGATSADGASGTAATVFKFEQNNYSPESLSEAEIYRQTNNQLSQAKSALGL
jgi:hypothetical protein